MKRLLLPLVAVPGLAEHIYLVRMSVQSMQSI